VSTHGPAVGTHECEYHTGSSKRRRTLLQCMAHGQPATGSSLLAGEEGALPLGGRPHGGGWDGYCLWGGDAAAVSHCSHCSQMLHPCPAPEVGVGAGVRAESADLMDTAQQVAELRAQLAEASKVILSYQSQLAALRLENSGLLSRLGPAV
jgi:hypothetical protein